MKTIQTVEIPVAGMDCTECTRHVQQAIAALPGVESVNVLLSSEKAIVRLDPTHVSLPAIHQAVERAGYSVPAGETPASLALPTGGFSATFSRRMMTFFALIFGAVLFIIVVGEWFGLFERLTGQKQSVKRGITPELRNLRAPPLPKPSVALRSGL